jgi:hypothetical protein
MASRDLLVPLVYCLLMWTVFIDIMAMIVVLCGDSWASTLCCQAVCLLVAVVSAWPCEPSQGSLQCFAAFSSCDTVVETS